MKRLLLYIMALLLPLNTYAQRQEARMLFSQARELLGQAEYGQAAELYHRALAMDNVAAPSLFNGYNELARCFTMMGNYQEAEMAYKQARTLIGDEDDYDAWLLNNASLLTTCGRYAEADSMLCLIELPSNQGLRDLSRSNIYYRQGDFEKATELLSQILVHQKQSSLYYTALQNRGYLRAQHPNQFALAEQDLLESLSYYTDGEQHYFTLSNLALIEARQGKHDVALKHINEALAWCRQRIVPKGKYPDYIIMLRKYAEILLMSQQRQKAAAAFKDFFDKEREFVCSTFSTMTEQNRLDFWKKEHPLLSEAFSLGQDAPDLLLDLSLFRREVALLGNADESKMQSRLSVTGLDVRKKLKAKEYLIDFVRYTPLSSSGLPEAAVYAAIVAPSVLSKEPVRFIPLWKESQINDYLLPSGTKLLDAVCSSSGKNKNEVYNDSRLAEYFWQPMINVLQDATDVYFAPDGILQLLAIENLNLPSLRNGQPRLHRMTSTLRLSEPRKTVQQDTKTTTSVINWKRLVIGGLNFNAAPDATLRDNPSHDALNCLLDAFPTGVAFSNLEGSEKEVTMLDSILQEPKIVRIIAEEEVRKELEGVELLHFSSHAYSLHVNVPEVQNAFKDSITEDRSLWSSGMVLSGANIVGSDAARDDGLLSARELCDMDLSSIRLAVISACQSAEGTVSDEGPTGLLRGLKKAGVRSIIATLWPIDDNVTTLFMSSFYGYLCSLGNASDAIMAARDYVRNYSLKKHATRFDPSTKRRITDTTTTEIYYPYREPYFWAPFILVDDY